jgi:predicted anti-sigma-YlaC factor YlaD
MACDGQQPSSCRGVAAETRQRANGSDEGLLSEVIGVLVVNQRTAQLPDLTVRGLDEGFEVGGVPRPGAVCEASEGVHGGHHKRRGRSASNRPERLRRAFGNFGPVPIDYRNMNCDTAREAISAVLDGEPADIDPAELDRHLLECVDCLRWREGAHELTRRVRLQPAHPAPRPTAQLMDAVHEQSSLGWWWPDSMTAARIGLVAVALAQLALCLPVLLFGQDHAAPVHVAHEMGSFDVAVAIGFLVAARRPARAMGMLSLVGIAAGLLVVTAVVDLMAGRTSLSDEAPHLLVVAGWLLLHRLATIAPPTSERPWSALAAVGTAWKSLTGRLATSRRAAVQGDMPLTGAASAHSPVPASTASSPGELSGQRGEAVG